MNQPVIAIRSGIFSLLFVGATLVWLGVAFGHSSSVDTTGVLTVSFLDVGQGDAIFIETPHGVQVLIDGGPDSSVVQRSALGCLFLIQQLM